MATTSMRVRVVVGVLAATSVIALKTGEAPAGAQGALADFPSHRRYCSATATAAFEACRDTLEPEHWLALGICANISDEDDREECLDEAEEARREEGAACRQQLAARQQVCEAVGEDRYDPDWDPSLFEDDFRASRNSNRYFPLRIGNRWEYRGGGEAVTVVALDRTKLVEGVTCLVVNDRVTENGRLVEDTDDWFAQARNGDVYYCGEEVKDFESIEGDNPQVPELVSIEGSFKAGRDGDKPGVIFRGAPRRGDVYRQEFSLGNAEDVAEILSTTYAFGSDPVLDQMVPRALAGVLCAGDCVVTKDFTALAPGVVERKYYAPGIGLFLEVKPSTGEVVQLVGCNVDARCGLLASR